MDEWGIPFALMVILAHPSTPCILHKQGTAHPWLVRVELMNPYKGTITHGSLISADKVLTAASIQLELTKAFVNVKEPLKPDALAVTVYDSAQDCNQTRYAERIQFHWGYNDKYFLNVGEFALITCFENFDTAGAPFLIPKPHNGIAKMVEAILSDMENGTSMAVSTYMFADQTAGAATIPDGKITFVPWAKCVEMENFKKINGDKDPALTGFSFFCSDKFPGKTGAAPGAAAGYGFDWYQGAPVVVQTQKSGNSSADNEFPIGQFLFWTGDNGSPFVFAAYTQHLFDFIEDREPVEASTDNTSRTDTFRPSRETFTFETRKATTDLDPDSSDTVIPFGGSNRCDSHGMMMFFWVIIFTVSFYPFGVAV